MRRLSTRRLLATTLAVLIGSVVPAVAQMTTVPGPGGVPLAPGLPVPGYTPGGIGPGGIEVAPGHAARDVPMYREGPGGILLAPRPDPRGREGFPTVSIAPPGCPVGSSCIGDILPHSLTLTITSRDAGPAKAPEPDAKIDSIHDLFAALRACWEPPARDHAQQGVQMSVRFAFKRSGELIAPPFVTYASPGTRTNTKQIYRDAIQASVTRCAPLPLSESLGAAIAGQPISIRFVEDRNLRAQAPQP
jgi:hypothetical protein